MIPKSSATDAPSCMLYEYTPLCAFRYIHLRRAVVVVLDAGPSVVLSERVQFFVVQIIE